MSKITIALAEQAYRVALKRHDGEFGITEALKKLSKTGLKQSSAADLVYNVSHLLNGKEYHRVLSIPIADAYLTWIRRDRGNQALTNGISAVNQHITYYENKQNVRRPGLRELVKKHEAIQRDGSSPSITLEYQDPTSRGYFDIFPLDLFAQEGRFKAVTHIVRSKDGTDYQAKCDLSIHGKIATLDYSPHPNFNDEQDMCLGTARIHFEDSDRTSIKRLEWQDEGSSTFKDCPFGTASYQFPPAAPYLQPSEPAPKTSRLIRERPGQKKFRTGLKSLYQHQCCITGCQIPEVLEGAHIDPYTSPESDNLKNGLLLRADIHKLFDRHLIAIHPTDLTIQLASELHEDPTYLPLLRKPLRLPSEPDYYPDQGALERHWMTFKSHA